MVLFFQGTLDEKELLFVSAHPQAFFLFILFLFGDLHGNAKSMQVICVSTPPKNES